MNIGEKINALRTEKGMTLEEFGDKVGVGKSTVRKWEKGIIENMKRDKIAKVADALGISPSYLMGWEDAEDAKTEKLNELFYLLNDKGQGKALEQVELLTRIPEYKAIAHKSEPTVAHFKICDNKNLETREIVNAAHERTDIEVTDEMRKHDNDIMSNPDEWK